MRVAEHAGVEVSEDRAKEKQGALQKFRVAKDELPAPITKGAMEGGRKRV